MVNIECVRNRWMDAQPGEYDWICASFGHPNGKSIGSAVFAQLMAECLRAHWRHLVNMIELVHIGATSLMWLNLCFPRPTGVLNSNAISIGSAVFAGLTSDRPTDRLTNHATRLVTTGCIYVRSTCNAALKKMQFLCFLFCKVVQKHQLGEVGK